MKPIHSSRNLTIEYDPDTERFQVTVRFNEETIVGYAPAPCPRCGSKSHVSLWELEGPGGDSNLIWLTCAADPPCLIDDEVLRWSREVIFERDWEDV
ncbi:MAG: hypothetical protein JW797_18080 [Bradymonadales bacterium]|nr:hypothetical protein [Bradymonadales bacterium]